MPAELVIPDAAAFDLACENAKALQNIVYMAKDEFNSIVGLKETGLDDVLIKYGKTKIAFYWAQTDQWAPPSNWDQVINIFKNKQNENDFDMKKYVLHWEIESKIKHSLIIDHPSKYLEEKLTEKIFQFLSKSIHAPPLF